jgi:hypothetical protein
LDRANSKSIVGQVRIMGLIQSRCVEHAGRAVFALGPGDDDDDDELPIGDPPDDDGDGDGDDDDDDDDDEDPLELMAYCIAASPWRMHHGTMSPAAGT